MFVIATDGGSVAEATALLASIYTPAMAPQKDLQESTGKPHSPLSLLSPHEARLTLV